MEAEHKQQTKQTASNHEALPTTKHIALCRVCLYNYQKNTINLTPKMSKRISQVIRKLNTIYWNWYLKEAATSVHLAGLHQCVCGHAGVLPALLCAAARALWSINTPFIWGNSSSFQEGRSEIWRSDGAPTEGCAPSALMLLSKYDFYRVLFTLIFIFLWHGMYAKLNPSPHTHTSTPTVPHFL